MMAIAFRLALLASLLAPAAASAAHSEWVEADESRMRLLLTPGDDGHIAGGVEIEIEPGWYTYWRNPGEAGVPPVFDFSRSENVAHVEVRYPAPERHDDGASVSLIYEDAVVFPLLVTPQDPARPVTLHLDADYGVCSEICIPTSASADVAYSGERDPPSKARIASFSRRVPGAAQPGRFEIAAVAAEENALVIDVRMPDSSYLDLFADPPAGWFIGQPSLVGRSGGVSRYRLSLAGRPINAELSGQTFRFVAVSGGAAIEEAVTVP